MRHFRIDLRTIDHADAPESIRDILRVSAAWQRGERGDDGAPYARAPRPDPNRHRGARRPAG